LSSAKRPPKNLGFSGHVSNINAKQGFCKKLHSKNSPLGVLVIIKKPPKTLLFCVPFKDMMSFWHVTPNRREFFVQAPAGTKMQTSLLKEQKKFAKGILLC